MKAETESSLAPNPEEPPKTTRIPRWVGPIATVALIVGIVGVILLYGYQARPGWVGVADKKFWDYLELLIVPAALAIGVYLLNRAQSERELAVENQRAQDEALQAYLDHMSQLLTDKDRPLHRSQLGDILSTVARARTLTVLSGLNGDRKGSAIRFLCESGLITRPTGGPPVVWLNGADLREADLRGAELRKVDLRVTNLSYADMREAGLSEAFLSGANLSGADLRSASLNDAELGADLRGANLSGAYLWGATMNGGDLRGANLSRAKGSDASFSGADLRGANLSGADLRRTILAGTDLRGADLRGADLYGAVGATTNEELEQQAKSLKGTIMPNGQLHGGEYVMDEIDPALSFRVGDGWRFSELGVWDTLSLVGPEDGQLNFTNPSAVFDSSNSSKLKDLPAPDDAHEWVSWLQRHPTLQTSEPVPVSVGGASGMRIDMMLGSSTLDNYPRDLCGEQPCVPLYRGRTIESTIICRAGWKDRCVIVDVEGETVVISVSAPSDKSDMFLLEAQKVLDTLEWERPSSIDEVPIRRILRNSR